MSEEKKYFRAGLGLRKEMNEVIDREFTAAIIEYMKANNYRLQVGPYTFVLAKEFGFCYGVERAINYSYQIFKKFPDKRVFITGEVIHNPFVNKRLLDMGVRFLSGQYQRDNKVEDIQAEDVVILPAFGVPVSDLQRFREIGCTIVDTTCGSVIVVWKNVEKYAQAGFTSVVHGKHYHEETRATCSQATKYEHGHYLVILDQKEAKMIADYLAGKLKKESFCRHFADAMSPDFDPDKHLQRIGMANQTTMLMSETQLISDYLATVYAERFGAEKLNEHFRAMDTICSATQERQDALKDLISEEDVDIFVIIGGFNSSNTANLANIGKATGKATYHIRGEEDILPGNTIRSLPGLKHEAIETAAWLPEKEQKIAVTAGASTPNTVIATVIEKILRDNNLSAELETTLAKMTNKN
jgi:4-hydroxy-3-methylbut-2-enyl diphosphate reductase